MLPAASRYIRVPTRNGTAGRNFNFHAHAKGAPHTPSRILISYAIHVEHDLFGNVWSGKITCKVYLGPSKKSSAQQTSRGCIVPCLRVDTCPALSLRSPSTLESPHELPRALQQRKSTKCPCFCRRIVDSAYPEGGANSIRMPYLGV